MKRMSEEIKENNIVEDQVKKNAERPHAILVIMGLIMVAVYMGMSFLLLFTTFFQGVMPAWARYLMGVVFFVYGIFRGYRVYKSR
jgi:cytochrome c biogenesis protein CcdA